jgi:lipopolysaccharide transport system ATP-binding protein
MTAAIRVEGLGKRYRVRQGQARTSYRTLRESLSSLVRSPFPGRGSQGDRDEIWALKDVSFEVQPGEVVGIIGRNGAGKSTLLKILSRITKPTKGRVHLNGRVGSLLEVGTGFHPELTGRENVYLNGSILSMSRKEIDRRFDEIVAFAEVERFLDTPVKRYSSGMYVRLAFAVAAHLEPDILIIDEVLAVGDTAFQAKCQGKMGDVSQQGRTVLFVSHNLAAIRSLCQRVIVLRQGEIVSDEVRVEAGLRSYADEARQQAGSLWQTGSQEPTKALQIKKVTLEVRGEQPEHKLRLGLQLESWRPHKDAFVAIDINTLLGEVIMQAVPTVEPFIRSENYEHECEVIVNLPSLIPGRYTVSVWVGSHFLRTLDFAPSCVEFEIERSPTPGRSFPHTADHGHIVPRAFVTCMAINKR